MMAGGVSAGSYHPVKLDPAIERWSHMRENTYQNFQFTSRATTRVMLWALLVPVATGFLFVRYDNKFDWAGKMKGSSLRQEALAVPRPQDED